MTRDFEAKPPNRVDRTAPRPVWLVPQGNEWRRREHLEITHEPFRIDHTATQGPGIIVRQGGQLITMLPEHLDEIFRALRSAESWEDEEA